MAINIEVRTSETVTATGKLYYYSFDVYEEGTPPKLLEAVNTTDTGKAQQFLESAKKKYSTSKVNGKQDGDPFSDGTFKIS